jgi:hypothetical protein
MFYTRQGIEWVAEQLLASQELIFVNYNDFDNYNAGNLHNI